MHGAGHISEYVLDPAADFGFLSVVCFLPIGQRMVAIALFADTVFHMIGDFFSDIGAVRVNDLIFFRKKFGKVVAVMYIGGCGGIIRDDFAVGVYPVRVPRATDR